MPKGPPNPVVRLCRGNRHSGHPEANDCTGPREKGANSREVTVRGLPQERVPHVPDPNPSAGRFSFLWGTEGGMGHVSHGADLALKHFEMLVTQHRGKGC